MPMQPSPIAETVRLPSFVASTKRPFSVCREPDRVVCQTLIDRGGWKNFTHGQRCLIRRSSVTPDKHAHRRSGRPCERGTGSTPMPRRGAGIVCCVDPTNDIAEFLATRRARVTPEQVGLPTYGARRVPGLRREEVASLAGVSVEYYKRLERGNANGVSNSVLEALASALQLNDAERAHLHDLAPAANPVAPSRRRPAAQRIRPSVQRVLDTISA